MTLDHLATKHSTDKASWGHGYCPFYEFLLARFCIMSPLSILEVGFQFGFSLKMWRDYFKQALIVGIDTVSNDVSFAPQEGIALIIGDAYTPEMIARLGNMEFDIVVDDADHNPEHQAFLVRHYSPMLSRNGILIVEDCENMHAAAGLEKSMPNGFQGAVVDLRKEGGMLDSILFLAWRV